jgi:hypothetical protein
MGQNVAGSDGHLDASPESTIEAGGDTPPVEATDGATSDAEAGGG